MSQVNIDEINKKIVEFQKYAKEEPQAVFWIDTSFHNAEKLNEIFQEAKLRAFLDQQSKADIFFINLVLYSFHSMNYSPLKSETKEK